jgi:hypothetical protein
LLDPSDTTSRFAGETRWGLTAAHGWFWRVFTVLLISIAVFVYVSVVFGLGTGAAAAAAGATAVGVVLTIAACVRPSAQSSLESWLEGKSLKSLLVLVRWCSPSTELMFVVPAGILAYSLITTLRFEDSVTGRALVGAVILLWLVFFVPRLVLGSKLHTDDIPRAWFREECDSSPKVFLDRAGAQFVSMLQKQLQLTGGGDDALFFVREEGRRQASSRHMLGLRSVDAIDVVKWLETQTTTT